MARTKCASLNREVHKREAGRAYLLLTLVDAENFVDIIDELAEHAREHGR